MNLKNIEDLINNEEIKEYVLKIIEYEQSQLHKELPRYKKTYKNIIEEATNEIYKNKDKKL